MKKIFLPVILFALSSLACNLVSRTPTAVVESVQPAAPAAAPATATAAQPTVPPTAAPTIVPPESPATPTASLAVSTVDPMSESPVSGGAPFPLVPPVDSNQNGIIEICEAIPAESMQVTLSRSLVGSPQPFQDPAMGDGCAFDFGKDDRAAYFAYIAIGTEKTFTDALANAVRAEPVTSIGDSAFLNYGPDARQLWVRLGDKSILVAIGDEERVDAMLVFGYYLVDYLAHNP